MSENEQDTFEGWAILELMGHRRLGGYVRQVEMFGAAMCRIDVPGPDGDQIAATQFYSGSSIYCLTPATEPMARAAALRNQPEPIQRWELPAPVEVVRRCVECRQVIPTGYAGDYCPGCNPHDDDDGDEYPDDDERG